MRVTQPIEPRNRRNMRIPSVNLMKRISPSKKVFPRKTAFIEKKMREAVAPMAGEPVKVGFRYMIRIIVNEVNVKRRFLSCVIVFSTFSNLEARFIFYRSWLP